MNAMDTVKKPPIGVSPRDCWLDLRARDLARAIHEYIEDGYIGGPRSHHIERWNEELAEVLAMRQKPANVRAKRARRAGSA